MRRKRRKPRVRRRTLTRGQKIAAAVLIGAVVLVGGLVYGAHELRSWAASLSVFKVTDACIIDAPEWLPPSVKSQLVRLYPVGGGVSIFDPDLLEEVESRYSRSPWVKKVEWVRKRYPNAIQCKMQMRKPVGAVHLRDKYYVTDSEGVRLPGAYESWPEAGYDIPAIEGVKGSRPAIGSKWGDPAVGAAAAVLKAVSSARLGGELGVKAIDVSNVGGSRKKSEVVLVAAEGAEILWGGAPGSKAVGEKPTPEKLVDLKRIAQDGSIGDYEYVDLRYKPPMLMRRFD